MPKPKYSVLFISAIGLIAILLHRYLITGNPLYPLFSQVFSSNNTQQIAFERMLRSYGRDAYFPLSLIIPKSLGEVGTSFGPALGLLLVLVLFRHLWIRNFQSHQWTAVIQICMLLMAGQGRPDYYTCPILLILSGQSLNIYGMYQGANQYVKSFCSVGRKIWSSIFVILLTGQVAIWFFLSGTSLYQTVASWKNYEHAMNQYAYGYNISNIINRNSVSPTVDIVHRNTKFYYTVPYIASERFTSCLANKNSSQRDLQVIACTKKLKVNTIVVPKGMLNQNKAFSCQTQIAYSGSRNPFNNSQEMFDLCHLRPQVN